ncbi:MAG TPA: Hsp20/alpha crystallin family protein [Anaerolineales bacterium]|nr:Hsp20/alpha crystallin family protein [Anaerolineales bacterium]
MTFYAYPFPRYAARRWANVNRRAALGVLGVNIREEDDAYVLSAFVPGLKSDDLNIQVLDDVLRIEGEYKDDEANYLLNELPSGSFSRTLRLPSAVEADQVEAHITDGILTLRLPKAESARPKKIKVNIK